MQNAAQKFLELYGWCTEGSAPKEKKYVLLAAPHTTNWDFVFTLAVARALGINMRFLAKKSLFRFPFRYFFEAVGGISVDRETRGRTVDALSDLFAKHDELVLVISAEGTRKRGKYWKSGFYHLAKKANVPVALGWLDYARKRGGVGDVIWPTGNVSADMDRIRAFYANVKGKYPELFTPPRLAEEDG